MNPLLEALLGTLGYVGSSLDKPGATVRGLLGGQGASALANLIPFSDTMGVTDPEQRMSGRGLLEHYGALDQKQPDDGFGFGDLLGMGVEAATDPLQWGGLAKLGSMVKGNRVARASNEIGMRNMMHNLDAQELVAKGAMPPEVAALTKARNEAGPVATYHGTPHAFERYDMAKMDPEGLYGPGIYTTVNPEIASEYASKDASYSLDLTRPDALADAAKRAIAEELESHQRHLAAAGGNWESAAEREMARESHEARLVALQGMARGDFDNPGIKALGDRYGITPFDLAGDYEVMHDFRVPPRSNVRKQFLDIRNPFDMDRQFLPEEYHQLTEKIAGTPVPSLRPVAGETGESIYNRLQSMHGRLRDDEGILDEIAPRFHRLAEEPANVFANEILKGVGYDGIMHTGGTLMGGGDRLHQVYIGFDPKQVYHPLVAPAMKQVPPYMDERRLSPLLAALAGENALTRTYPQGA